MVLLSGLFEKWQFEPQLGARGAPLARIRSNQFPRLGQWRGQAGLLANIGSGEIINRRTINSDRRLVFKFYTPLQTKPSLDWLVVVIIRSSRKGIMSVREKEKGCVVSNPGSWITHSDQWLNKNKNIKCFNTQDLHLSKRKNISSLPWI